MQPIQALAWRRSCPQHRGANSTGEPICTIRSIQCNRSNFSRRGAVIARLAASAERLTIQSSSTPPQPASTCANFEERYRHHMETPNRYCRYGDIELYAPSEDCAATLLKAVAEPLARAQRWLRLGNGLSHIVLYELLKVFSSLGGGDRELILAAPEELDAVQQQAAGERPGGSHPYDLHVLNPPQGVTSGSGKDNGCSISNGNGNGYSPGRNAVPACNGNSGHGDGHPDGDGRGTRLADSLSSNGSSGYGSDHHKNSSSSNSNNDSNGCYSGASGNGNGNGCTLNDGSGNRSGALPAAEPSSQPRQHAQPSATFSPGAAAPAPPPPPPPQLPGFLLLRAHPADRPAALHHPALRTALAAGACQSALLVEMYDSRRDDGADSRSGNVPYGGWDRAVGLGVGDGGSGITGAGVGGIEEQGSPAPGVTAAKYRLWSRMMEAALLQAAAAYEGLAAGPGADSGAGCDNGNGAGNCNGAVQSLHTPERARVDGEDSGVGDGGGGGRGVLKDPNSGLSPASAARGRPPVVLWGLLTSLHTWRFYCLREVRYPTGADASLGAAASRLPYAHQRPHSHPYGLHAVAVPKFELLGSRQLHVADPTLESWPGLVPALAALYGILCTPDGLALRRQLITAPDTPTHEMPYDAHRDQLMRFHLIMGARNTPVYGAVGEWVRQRLDEYVRCRRGQKRLRAMAEAVGGASPALGPSPPAAVVADAAAALCAAGLQQAAPSVASNLGDADSPTPEDAAKLSQAAPPPSLAPLPSSSPSHPAAVPNVGELTPGGEAAAASVKATAPVAAAMGKAAAPAPVAVHVDATAPVATAAAAPALMSAEAEAASVSAAEMAATLGSAATAAPALPYSTPMQEQVQDEPLSSLSSGEWEPVYGADVRGGATAKSMRDECGEEEKDKEGFGARGGTAGHAAEATECFPGRAADAWKQLAQARERAARLRKRARALGAVPRGGPGDGAAATAAAASRHRRPREPAAAAPVDGSGGAAGTGNGAAE